MGKKSVVFCDLTKQEVEDDSALVTIVIKIPGKKQGRTYELSAEAAAKLERQLVAGNKLDTNWSFNSSLRSPSGEEQSPRTIGNLIDDDDQFISDKKREMRDEGIDLSPREKEEDQSIMLPEIAVDGSDCLHMNKGPVQTTLRNGERHFYRVCRACRGRVAEKLRDDRKAFLAAKPPAGSRVDYKE